MSITQRGARRISIGDAVYAWRIRKRPTYSQGSGWSPMLVGVQRVAPPARGVLVLELDVTRPDAWIARSKIALGPADVAAGIAEALRAGWDPLRGPQFCARHAV